MIQIIIQIQTPTPTQTQTQIQTACMLVHKCAIIFLHVLGHGKHKDLNAKRTTIRTHFGHIYVYK